jgi:hypothetical protein
VKGPRRPRVFGNVTRSELLGLLVWKPNAPSQPEHECHLRSQHEDRKDDEHPRTSCDTNPGQRQGEPQDKQTEADGIQSRASESRSPVIRRRSENPDDPTYEHDEAGSCRGNEQCQGLIHGCRLRVRRGPSHRRRRVFRKVTRRSMQDRDHGPPEGPACTGIGGTPAGSTPSGTKPLPGTM